jgi:purine-binding chemotaxis protein CheW
MENTITSPVQQNTSVVAFRLDQRTFALPLDVIVQILPMMLITPIPHISKIVKGTINIRGEDVLVINLRSHFGVEEIDLQLYTPLLLLKLNDRLLALIVDAVLDVTSLPLEKLTSLQNILPEGIEDSPMLRGVTYHNDETILVLDPERLFYNQHPIQRPIDPLIISAESDAPAADRALIEGALAENNA